MQYTIADLPLGIKFNMDVLKNFLRPVRLLGRRVPWTMSPLNNAFLGRRVPDYCVLALWGQTPRMIGVEAKLY